MTADRLITAKVDLASTAAAVLAFTQAAAAALGVLAVWRTPEGLIGIPDIEQLGVGLLTALVAIALAVGCAYVLTGRTSGMIVVASVGSLVISAYWAFLRPPIEGFPSFPVAYAVLPVLILGVLALSHARAARPPRTAESSGEPTNAPPARDMLVE